MMLFKKICLFLSSFSPLFLLIVIKEIVEIVNGNWSLNFLNIFLLIVLFTLFCFGVVALFLLFKEVKTTGGKKCRIIEKKNITDQHFLGYFSLFVLFAVTFEIEMYSMALIFFIILIMIGIVYIRNDFYYINPLINLLGYSFYDVTLEKEGKRICLRAFYRGKIDIGKEYIIIDKYNNFILLKSKKDL